MEWVSQYMFAEKVGGCRWRKGMLGWFGLVVLPRYKINCTQSQSPNAISSAVVDLLIETCISIPFGFFCL